MKKKEIVEKQPFSLLKSTYLEKKKRKKKNSDFHEEKNLSKSCVDFT